MNKHHVPTVLVVDDEIHILQVLSLKLGESGYRVLTARDGRQAFEIAQVEKPDMIIADYQMPYLNGVQLCEKLNNLPHAPKIPFVLLTAHGYHLDGESVAAAGIRCCVHKPFSPRGILQLVDDLMPAPSDASLST